MAFSFIKEQIDRDYKKWKATCKKRSEAEKLGGRPKKQELSSDSEAKAKKSDNVSECVSDNENKNDSGCVSEIESLNSELDEYLKYLQNTVLKSAEKIYDHNTDNTNTTDYTEQCIQSSVNNVNEFYDMYDKEKKAEPEREEVIEFAKAHNAIEYADKFYSYYNRHNWRI